MDRGEIFRGLNDAASRSRILENILSIEIIIPSLKTFHENMKYFAIGAKILRQHILSEEEELDGQISTIPQKLDWSLPNRPCIEAADGNFWLIQQLDFQQALKLLFLFAIRFFPYLSNDRPKQDRRGEVMAGRVDGGFVYFLQRGARLLGFSSPKIEKGLAGRQPVCGMLFDVPDRQIDFKWKCGKPGIRAFLHLQDHAFFPELATVNGKDGPVPMFVFRDFMDAFFDCDDFMIDTCDPWSERDIHAFMSFHEQRLTVDQRAATSTEVDIVDRDTSTSENSQLRDETRRHDIRWRPALNSKGPTAVQPTQNRRRSASPQSDLDLARQSRHFRSPHLVPRTTNEATISEAAVSADTTMPQPEVRDMNTGRRSPVACPDLSLQTYAPANPRNTKPEDPLSRRRRPLVRYSLANLSNAAPPLEEKKTSNGVNRKKPKRKKRSSKTTNAVESSLKFISQPRVSFTDNRSLVFSSIAAQSSQSRSSVKKRRRDVAQLEDLPRLRDLDSMKTDEPRRKRRKYASGSNSSHNLGSLALAQQTRSEAVIIQPNSQENKETFTSSLNHQQRSPVAAPSSGSDIPLLNQQSTTQLDHEMQRDITTMEAPHIQVNPSLATDNHQSADEHRVQAESRGVIFDPITMKTDKPRRKRRKHASGSNSGHDLGSSALAQKTRGEVTTAEPNSQENKETSASSLDHWQRSPVAAPSSGIDIPPPNQQSMTQLGHEMQIDSATIEAPHIQVNPALARDNHHSADERHIEAESGEDTFDNVETFSQTRIQSPGTYTIDDWFRPTFSRRSPVTSPESDL